MDGGMSNKNMPLDWLTKITRYKTNKNPNCSGVIPGLKMVRKAPPLSECPGKLLT